MSLMPIAERPRTAAYDVIIIGGAIMGSSAASFLTANPDFDGSILVVERDPSYATASSSHTNSCIRQQFSSEINIRISQFGVAYLKDFRAQLGGDPEVPEIHLEPFGYMYLASDEQKANRLRAAQQVQAANGVATRLLSRDQLAQEYPFYRLDDIVLGSHNPVDEGYFDGNTMFQWWRRMARVRGAEYITNEVVAINRDQSRVTGVRLASGETISAGLVINASGPRAARTAAMAGLSLPVEPRKRFTFIFEAEHPLQQTLPLTIDPSGVHVRQDGKYYMCGCPPDDDKPVDHDDFQIDHAIWEQKLWPALAHRIPAFEAIRVVNFWAGHYAFNTLDHNAIIGPHPELSNFLFLNGFSGHGLQQSPAMGCGISELVTYGAYRTLDLTPLGYDRIASETPFVELAVI